MIVEFHVVAVTDLQIGFVSSEVVALTFILFSFILFSIVFLGVGEKHGWLWLLISFYFVPGRKHKEKHE